jgi:hypothetical protein
LSDEVFEDIAWVRGRFIVLVIEGVEVEKIKPSALVFTLSGSKYESKSFFVNIRELV